MKKNLLIALSFVMLSTTIAVADEFDSLNGITPAQKQKLSQITLMYKNESNTLEKRIIEYNTEKARLQRDREKSPTDIAMMTAAYDKNIQVMKAQKAKLDKDTDALYKSVLTEEQYKQYQAQKVQTENAFSNFLQK